MSLLSADEFCKVCYECDFEISDIQASLKSLGQVDTSPGRIKQRIANLQRKGLLPLDSGNFVESSTVLKSISTSYDAQGNLKSQRITSNIPVNDQLDVIQEAISLLVEAIPPIPKQKKPPKHLDSKLMNVVVSNDLHFGLLTDSDDTSEDWKTSDIVSRVKDAYDHLFANLPKAKYAIVVDLGDLLEAENNLRKTRRSGHTLDTDGKFAHHFRAAYESLIYAVEKALETHETVYFYNVHGNHCETENAMSIREIIRVRFLNNPRVIVNTKSHGIKYHQFGEVLLQFFHGHSLRMHRAPEVMATDASHIFSQTKFRYGLSGHVHKESVYDSPIARIESFRTIIPNNTYAFEHGYRTNHGSMQAITYHANLGEVSRTRFNVQDSPLDIPNS